MGSEKTLREKHKRHSRKVVFTILAMLVGLVVLLIVFAPTLASLSPFRAMILSRVNRQISGTLTIDSWHLGWRSGLVAKDVSLKNESGEVVVSTPVLKCQPKWSSLLGKDIFLGAVTLDRPTIRILAGTPRYGFPGSKKERPEAEPRKAARRFFGKLIVTGGTVELVSEKVSESLHELDLEVALPAPAASLEFSTSFEAAAEEGTGKFTLRGKVHLPEDQSFSITEMSGDVTLDAPAFDLRALSPLVSSSRWPVSLAGTASASGNLTFTGTKTFSAEGRVSAAGFEVSGEPLKGDTLRLKTLDVPFSLLYENEILDFKELKCESDLFSFTAKGTLPRKTLAGFLAGELEGVPAPNFSAELRADLPGLARSLPHTLRVPQGSTIASGQLAASLSAMPEDKRWTAHGKMELADFSAERSGKTYRLTQPIQGKFDVWREGEDFGVKEMELVASFGELRGSVEGKRFVASSRFDLEALQKELSQFVDFGKATVSGAMESQTSIEKADKSQWEIRSETVFRNLKVDGLFEEPVEETEAKVAFEGALGRKGREGSTLEIRKLSSELSFLSADLSGSLAGVGTKKVRFERLEGSASGSLNLLSRLVGKRFLSRLGTLSGKFHGNGKAFEEAEALRFEGALAVSDFHAQGFLKAGKAGDLKSDSLEASVKGTLKSSSKKSLSIEEFSFRFPFAEAKGSANLEVGKTLTLSNLSLESVKLDFAGLSQSSQGVLPPGISIGGAASVRAELRQEKDSALAFDVSGQTQAFKVAEKELPLFERDVQIEATGTFGGQNQPGTFVFETLKVSSSGYPQLLIGEGQGNTLRSDGSFFLQCRSESPVAILIPLVNRNAKRPQPVSGSGDVSFKGKVAFEQGKEFASKGKAVLSNFELFVTGQKQPDVSESRLDADFDLSYGIKDRNLRITSLAVSTPDLEVSASANFSNIGKEPLPSEAKGKAEGNLAKVLEKYGALLPFSIPKEVQPSGKFLATFNSSTTPDRLIQANGNFDVQAFSILWNNETFDFGDVPSTFEVSLDPKKENLNVKGVRATLPFAVFEGRGTLEHYRHEKDLSAKVTVEYDLEKATRFFAKFLPAGLTITGRRSEEYPLSGTLQKEPGRSRLEALSVGGSVGFDSLSWKGLDVASAELPLSMQGGLLNFGDVNAPLDGGTILLRGRIDFRKKEPPQEEAPLFSIPRDENPVVRNLPLKKDMVFIRFLNPIFGNFASISGTADVTLEEDLTFPLSRDLAKRAYARGVVTIRDLVVRESLLLRQILALAGGGTGEIQAISPIRFELKDARVHIEETTVQSDGKNFGFSGSIGLDESVDMELLIPINVEMLGSDSDLYHYLEGEKLTVPISGTLSKPSLGGDIFQKNLKNLIKAAAKKAVEEGARKLLEDILH